MHMRLGLGFSQPGGGPSISDLFASNAAKGFALDANPAYLWQDTARTTAVTTPGQTVGGITDVSGQGNHLSQATAGNRPIYGIRPFRGRVNLLTNSETFDNAAWSKVRATVTANAIAAPNGETTADLILETVDAGTHRLSQAVTIASGATVAFTVRFKQHTVGRNLSMGIVGGANFVETYFSSTDGTVIATGDSVGAVFSGKTNTISGPDSAGYYTVTITVTTATVTSLTLFLGVASGTVNSYAGDITKGIYLWGAQIEQGALSAYQRVGTTVYDCTESGQSSVHYVRFATNKFLQTAAIDFSDRDCVAVASGLRKMSDAAQGVVAELTASLAANNGAFLLDAPASAAANFTITSKGTVAAAASYTNAAVAAPTTAVITGQADISADSGILRRNGVQVATVATDQGTGNFSNAVVYVGARGGLSLFADMELTSLVVFSTATTISAADLSRLEAIAATKTGVTL